jgi:hypothetical protein
MPALRHRRAVSGEDAPDGRVRSDGAHTALGQLERAREEHPVRVVDHRSKARGLHTIGARSP